MIESASLSALAGMVRPIATATARLATPSSRNSCDVVMPAFCRTATSTALPAMKAALSTLTAATTRARRSAPAPACTAAQVGTTHREARHDEQAAGDGEPREIDRKARAAERAEQGQIAGEPGNRGGAQRRPAEIDREQAQKHGADQGRKQDDPSGRQPGGEA